MGQLGNPDDERQRGILDQGDKLVDERGDHVAQPLGEDDIEHGLPVGQAGGDSRFHLSFGDSLNTGADDLNKKSGTSPISEVDNRGV